MSRSRAVHEGGKPKLPEVAVKGHYAGLVGLHRPSLRGDLEKEDAIDLLHVLPPQLGKLSSTGPGVCSQPRHPMEGGLSLGRGLNRKGSSLAGMVFSDREASLTKPLVSCPSLMVIPWAGLRGSNLFATAHPNTVLSDEVTVLLLVLVAMAGTQPVILEPDHVLGCHS